ncbi:fumarylacetoacetate hydrolase family protein [Acrocarpospora macrocephala]|uniref:fumarylacetoacetate hydrolase family protein n=1 Tax=Acrocarpospora macrocephala TaxID=150177 RepID=UPI0012D30A21|nr:fumarylacetoacetate hydrolase family protein [Acrocarpospora macrocephala]
MAITSWVWVPGGSGFPGWNLPFGVFSRRGELPRVGVAIGDHVVDLDLLRATGVLPNSAWFAAGTLNWFLAAGPEAWRSTRERLIELLSDEQHRPAVMPALVPMSEVLLHLPFAVADLACFQGSLDHTTNMGRMFRPPTMDPVRRNWRQMPVAHHGRAGSVVVSGTPIMRPSGQRGEADVGPSMKLDIGPEIGYVVGVPANHPVGTKAFRDHVFGVVLVNTWRAQDLLAWEYQDLGPFTGRAFATTISPWVVPLDALEHARTTQPPQQPSPPGYLTVTEPWGLDLALEVSLNDEVISRPPYGLHYWTGPQLLTHTTVSGAQLRTGDLLTSGPISGPEDPGTLLEMTWNGKNPLRLPKDAERVFLEDGDTVTITAKSALGVGLGEVTGTVRSP